MQGAGCMLGTAGLSLCCALSPLSCSVVFQMDVVNAFQSGSFQAALRRQSSGTSQQLDVPAASSPSHIASPAAGSECCS